jgi:hypothetical protein
MNDILLLPPPPPKTPKRKRHRKNQQSHSVTDGAAAPAIVTQPGCVAQTRCQESCHENCQASGQDVHQDDRQEGCNQAADLVVLSPGKKKRTRRPRKRKTNVEAPVNMIVSTDPIVSDQTEPLKLAVPVGSPYPAAAPKPARPAALTPQIEAIRAALPAPAEYDLGNLARAEHWQPFPPSSPRSGQTLSSGPMSSPVRDVPYYQDAPRRRSRFIGLAMTAILLGISVTTAIVLSDAPKPEAKRQTAAMSPVLASAPAASLMQKSPASTTGESDALAGVRIVDPSWDKKMSCNEGTWPYIDQRCLVKEGSRSAARAENKIGPRMMIRRPAAPETTGPIGSTTAIVPAAPKAIATDGVAVREADIEKHEGRHDIVAPAPVLRAAPPKPVETRTSTVEIRTAPVESRMSVVETRTPTVTVEDTAPRYTRSSRWRKTAPVRTYSLSEETAAPAVTSRRATSVRRAATVTSVKRKRQTYVAEAGRRSYGRVTQAQAPQAPQFFFPFGWFVQAR